MMLFTKEQIEKIKDVLNKGGKVVFKISRNHEVDKFEIVLYKPISDYTFEYYLECYLLRKIRGKSYSSIFTTLEFELFDSNGDYIYYNHCIVNVDCYKL